MREAGAGGGQTDTTSWSPNGNEGLYFHPFSQAPMDLTVMTCAVEPNSLGCGPHCRCRDCKGRAALRSLPVTFSYLFIAPVICSCVSKQLFCYYTLPYLSGGEGSRELPQIGSSPTAALPDVSFAPPAL